MRANPKLQPQQKRAEKNEKNEKKKLYV